jgi:hypothetical protein
MRNSINIRGYKILNRKLFLNRESQTIRDDSRDSQRLRYIFTIHIESYDSYRESYDFNITGLEKVQLVISKHIIH